MARKFWFSVLIVISIHALVIWNFCNQRRGTEFNAPIATIEVDLIEHIQQKSALVEHVRENDLELPEASPQSPAPTDLMISSPEDLLPSRVEKPLKAARSFIPAIPLPEPDLRPPTFDEPECALPAQMQSRNTGVGLSRCVFLHLD